MLREVDQDLHVTDRLYESNKYTKILGLKRHYVQERKPRSGTLLDQETYLDLEQ